jgi:hypothetical protein
VEKTLLNPDYRDMLCMLNEEGVEYLVVGAHALAAHGYPRATGDIDLWIRCSHENALRVWRVLCRFGAPMQDLTVGDLSTPDVVFQIGIPPRRIDILTSIAAVTFEEAWPRRKTILADNVQISVIGREDLLRNKWNTGRTKDRADAEWLEAHPPAEAD